MAFLEVGAGAERWLISAAAEGTPRVRRTMAEAVDLAKLHGSEEVSAALAACAEARRFGDGDLAALLAHQAAGTVSRSPSGGSEERSLQRSSKAWEGFGR